MNTGTLYFGDCLNLMREWPDECVDLIYLDPPFNSKTNYNILFSTELADEAQFRAYNDTWHWDEAAGERMAMFEDAIGHPLYDTIGGLFRVLGPCGMMAYLTYMAERLLATRRLLKPTGSIYLHCDPTASHYLKVLMDSIYGGKFFRTEIVWQRSQGFKRKTARKFPQKNDIILFYQKTKDHQFNTQYLPHKPEYVKRFKQDPEGRLYRDDVNPTKGGRRTIYLDETKGDIVNSVWIDIPPVNPQAKERLGFETQKPVALLERIIKASSNEGDVVLDPFCGCGTAIEAAHNLRRKWVGIDICPYVIDLIRHRRKGLQDVSIQTDGIPNSLSAARLLASEKPFAFETWAVCRIQGFVPNDPEHQRGDGGIDGRGKLVEKPDNYPSRLALAQVKGGKFSASEFRDFKHVIERDKAAVGCFLTLDPIPRSARADAKQYGSLKVAGQRYDRLHPFSMKDYFDKRPPVLPAMLDPYTGKPVYQMTLL